MDGYSGKFIGFDPSPNSYNEPLNRCLTGNDVIQAAIADIVGPAVTTHNPEAAASKHVFPEGSMKICQDGNRMGSLSFLLFKFSHAVRFAVRSEKGT